MPSEGGACNPTRNFLNGALTPQSLENSIESYVWLLRETAARITALYIPDALKCNAWAWNPTRTQHGAPQRLETRLSRTCGYFGRPRQETPHCTDPMLSSATRGSDSRERHFLLSLRCAAVAGISAVELPSRVRMEFITAGAREGCGWLAAVH